MEETIIWVTGLIAEILLVVTAVFAVLLRRSRKSEQQLRDQLANHEKPSAERVVTEEIPVAPSAEMESPQVDLAASESIEMPALAAPTAEAAMPEPPPLDALKIELSEIEGQPSKTADTSITNEFDQLLVSVEDAKLDESVERLQQRLEATTRSLQRLTSGLQHESATSEQGNIEFASMQLNLQKMAQEVDSLQQSSTQLQQDLRRRTQSMKHIAAESQEQKEAVLQHAQKLRSDVAALRDKLKDSEGDVQRLQVEKESLAEEFSALNKEYERIYPSAST